MTPDELTITITRGNTTITTFTTPTLTINPKEFVIPLPSPNTNHRAKLTTTQVASIRSASKVLQRNRAWRVRTAEKLGVTPANINHILAGRTWKNG